MAGDDIYLFILVLIIIGVMGVCLNTLVIIAVRRNKNLSTSINNLLVWICIFSIFEATLGITTKIIILGALLFLFNLILGQF